MTLPMEVLLVGAVLALYLQDAALLLHYDEVALVRTRRGWRASTGGIEARDRRLFVPDFFRPAQPLFRASWLSTPQRERPATQMFHFVDALSVFARPLRLLWLCLFVALPLLLWRRPDALWLLALTLLIYGITAWLCVRVWQFRRVLELSERQALCLAFELLCCPPHALNLVRRLSLRRGLDVDAVDAVRRLLPSGIAARAGEQMEQRLSYAMALRGEEAGLLRARNRLEELR